MEWKGQSEYGANGAAALLSSKETRPIPQFAPMQAFL